MFNRIREIIEDIQGGKFAIKMQQMPCTAEIFQQLTNVAVFKASQCVSQKGGVPLNDAN